MFNIFGVGDQMWKLLGWPLAFAAVVGAYWLQVQNQKHEQVLKEQIQVQQQLVAQVSNRLAVVEAQFSTYRLKQEKEAKEREHELDRDRPHAPLVNERPAVNSHPSADPLDEEPTETREEPRSRRTSNPGRSIGNGINSIIDRLRDGFNN